jgi:hypothetical protein
LCKIVHREAVLGETVEVGHADGVLLLEIGRGGGFIDDENGGAEAYGG